MKSLRTPLALAGLVLASGLAFAAASDDPVRDQRDQSKKHLDVGSTVPAELTLNDIDGKPTSFGSLRDKHVILHFWSDRCPYERHANPIFTEMEKLYAENDKVVLIGIDSNKTELGEKPGKDADYSKLYGNLRERREEVGHTHTLLADHGNVVADLFQARSTPHCFVIDPEGVIRYAGALDDDPKGEKGDEATNYPVEAVTALLAGREVKVEKTKPYGCSIKRE